VISLGAVSFVVAHMGQTAGSSSNFDPWLSLTQYGPLGLMVLGFITGWIVPGPAVKAKDAEIRRLQSLFEDQVVPMTQTYATTMAQTTEVLKEITPVLSRAADLVREQSERRR